MKPRLVLPLLAIGLLERIRNVLDVKRANLAALGVFELRGVFRLVRIPLGEVDVLEVLVFSDLGIP